MAALSAPRRAAAAASPSGWPWPPSCSSRWWPPGPGPAGDRGRRRVGPVHPEHDSRRPSRRSARPHAVTSPASRREVPGIGAFAVLAQVVVIMMAAALLVVSGRAVARSWRRFEREPAPPLADLAAGDPPPRARRRPRRGHRGDGRGPGRRRHRRVLGPARGGGRRRRRRAAAVGDAVGAGRPGARRLRRPGGGDRRAPRALPHGPLLAPPPRRGRPRRRDGALCRRSATRSSGRRHDRPPHDRHRRRSSRPISALLAMFVIVAAGWSPDVGYVLALAAIGAVLVVAVRRVVLGVAAPAWTRPQLPSRRRGLDRPARRHGRDDAAPRRRGRRDLPPKGAADAVRPRHPPLAPPPRRRADRGPRAGTRAARRRAVPVPDRGRTGAAPDGRARARRSAIEAL